MQLNLYLISQNINRAHDTYDSAVVCAPSEKAAKLWHPDGTHYRTGADMELHFQTDWCHPAHVEAKLIGRAAYGVDPGVLCASFNAG